MSNAAKKLSLALYLNPETSQADRYAVGALQQWYSKTKRTHADRAELDMVVRLFHRDIYLAGLYLHLLSPRLCQGIASALDHHHINLVTLQQLCTASGLSWEQTSAALHDGFSPTQVAQLQQLLHSGPLPACADLSEPAADTSTLLQTIQQQGEQLDALLSETLALRQLAEEQARQLGRLRSGVAPAAQNVECQRGVQSEAADVTELMPNLAQIQQIKKKGLF